MDLPPDRVPVVLLDNALLRAIDLVLDLELLLELLEERVCLELHLDLYLVVGEGLAQVSGDALHFGGRALDLE